MHIQILSNFFGNGDVENYIFTVKSVASHIIFLSKLVGEKVFVRSNMWSQVMMPAQQKVSWTN